MLSPCAAIGDLYVRYDGFVFPGGKDLDPVLYGESPLPQTVLEEPERGLRLKCGFTLTLHKVCVFRPSFTQSLGGNPFLRKHGCPTENLGHDGKRTMIWR